jgi:hypothetical protein
MAVREYKGKIAIRDERAEREKKTSRIMTHDEKCAPCHYQPNPLNPKTRLWVFSKKFLPALQGGNRQCGCLL